MGIWEKTVEKKRIDLNLPNVAQKHWAPCYAGLKKQEHEREKVAQMETSSVPQSAITKWASLILFVPKIHWVLSFSVDYCQMNAVTVRDIHFKVHMIEHVSSLGEAKRFSTCDGNSRYGLIQMNKIDVAKTAFVTHNELYNYTKMPFILEVATLTFW